MSSEGAPAVVAAPLISDNQYSLPKVSVIVMNYNYASFLPVAIESCLRQTYESVETIVVDDGSTDSSREIIESYGDRIISVLKENGGQSSALNAGFQASSGDIICFLDADDLFLPERISRVVELFKQEPQVGWVFTESAPVETARIALPELDCLFNEIRAISKKEETKRLDLRAEVKSGKIPDSTPSTSNLCFSRDLCESIFPLPEIKGLSGMAITDIYVKTIAVGLSLGYLTNQNIGIYRFHNNYYKNLELDKKRRMFGEIYTTTGYWIRENYPSFAEISAKLLAKGFSTYLKSQYSKDESADADCNQMLKDYLRKSSLLGRCKVCTLIAYYSVKLNFKNFV